MAVKEKKVGLADGESHELRKEEGKEEGRREGTERKKG